MKLSIYFILIKLIVNDNIKIYWLRNGLGHIRMLRENNFIFFQYFSRMTGCFLRFSPVRAPVAALFLFPFVVRYVSMLEWIATERSVLY